MELKELGLLPAPACQAGLSMHVWLAPAPANSIWDTLGLDRNLIIACATSVCLQRISPIEADCTAHSKIEKPPSPALWQKARKDCASPPSLPR